MVPLVPNHEQETQLHVASMTDSGLLTLSFLDPVLPASAQQQGIALHRFWLIVIQISPIDSFISHQEVRSDHHSPTSFHAYNGPAKRLQGRPVPMAQSVLMALSLGDPLLLPGGNGS